jgi:mRNA interferase RelE/StbE
VPRHYRIEIAPTAFQSLKAIKDKKIRSAIAKVIDGLSQSPEQRGKLLLGPLEGVRSARAARDRYRILYRVHTRARRVSVLLVGERRPGEEADIYALARKLLETFGGPKKD